MKPIVAIVVLFLLGAVPIGTSIYYAPYTLPTEYSTQISVETSDKIESTVSNAVADLEKRDFVPVSLTVRWHPASKTYVIHIGGIDRTHLGKYEP